MCRKTLFFIVLLSVSLGFATKSWAKSGDAISELKASNETGSMFRWWIPAAFMEYDEVDAELKTIADKGFKGVEICINMSDSNYSKDELKENGWGTDNWNKMYKYILQQANKYGVQVDVTISPAWPASVPTITPEDDAAARVIKAYSTEVFQGTYSGEVPMTNREEVNTIMDLLGVGGDEGGGEPQGPEGQGGEPAGPEGNPPADGGGEPPANTEQAAPMEMPMEAETEVPNTPTLFTVVAAKITGTDTRTKTIVFSWGDPPYNPQEKTYEVTLLDPNSLQEVTDYTYDEKTGKYQISWTAPDDGDWKLFSYWEVGTAQENKQGDATYDPSFVINHFSKSGAQAIIDYWNDVLLADDETVELQRENGGYIFEDSLELESDGIYWSEDMREEFKERRGYDITKYLPVITATFGGPSGENSYGFYEFDNGNGKRSDMADRIRHDLNQLQTALYIDYHIKPIQDWAHSLGMKYRAQVYGTETDVMQVSAAADGMDVESLGFSSGTKGDDKYRQIYGAANMSGSSIISDEVGALSNEGYRLTWRDMLVWINKGYANGATQMVFHGFPYLKTNSSVWPGASHFGFGLGGYWGPREPGWDNIEEFADHLARTQYVLQSGQPQRDVAICHYINNLVYLKVFEDQSMAQDGYTYDIISPNLLNFPSGTVIDGVLDPDGAAYKALIFNNEPVIPFETAEKLLDYAQKGLKIIFVGSVPTETAYFPDYEANDQKMGKIMNELLQMKSTVKLVDSEADVLPALKEFGITPAADYEQPSELFTIHRIIDGIDYYYLYNYGTADINMDVAFDGEGKPFYVDSWSGKILSIEDYKTEGEKIATTVTLTPEETAILAFDTTGNIEAADAMPDFYTAATGSFSKEQVINDGWTLSVESWEDAKNPENTAETKKTTIDVGQTELKPWKDIAALNAATSGIGVYKTTFDLDKSWVGKEDVLISLGEVDGCSASLWINGTRVYVNQYSFVADVADYLKAGENTIEVKVTSTLGNRLMGDGKISSPSWDPTAETAYEKYGLVGPVKLGYNQ